MSSDSAGATALSSTSPPLGAGAPPPIVPDPSALPAAEPDAVMPDATPGNTASSSSAVKSRKPARCTAFPCAWTLDEQGQCGNPKCKASPRFDPALLPPPTPAYPESEYAVVSHKRRRTAAAESQPSSGSAPHSKRADLAAQRTASAVTPAAAKTPAAGSTVRRSLSFSNANPSAAQAVAPASVSAQPAATAARQSPAPPPAKGSPAPRPKERLFQDQSLLRELNIQATREEVVVLQVRRPLKEILGTAWVRTDPSGAIKVSFPPARFQTATARVWFRRTFALPAQHAPLPPPPALSDALDLAAAAAEGESMRERFRSLHVDPLVVAVFTTAKIRILPSRSGHDSFTLVLTYPNAVYGAEALRVLSEKRDAAAAARSMQSASSSFPFGAMSFGRERYICGVLRRFPTGLGLPSSQELADLCTSVGASAVRLKAVDRELVFEGDVKFAVPARHAAQLALLKGKYPSLRVLKKVSPLEQMCSQCFKKGHSRRQCTEAKQLCKHCKSADHLCTDCPSLTGAREQWRPCVLCEKRGHCVTSCPQFQPQLIPVELKPKKSEFAMQPQEFPAPQAARPAPAAASAAPAPRQATPAATPASAKVAKAAAPVQSKSYAAVTAAANPKGQPAKPASGASSASLAAAAAASSAPSAAAGADDATLHAILQKLTALSGEITALRSSVKVLSENQEGFAARLEILSSAGPNEYADDDDVCVEIEDDQEEEKSAGPVQPACSTPAAHA